MPNKREKTITTEVAMVKDRMLRSYRWFMAIADNENINAAALGMEVQQNALEIALALLKTEQEDPRISRFQGILLNVIAVIALLLW